MPKNDLFFGFGHNLYKVYLIWLDQYIGLLIYLAKTDTWHISALTVLRQGGGGDAFTTFDIPKFKPRQSVVVNYVS